MDRDNNIVIDNIQINDKLIQSAFDNAKYQNKTHQVLSQTFRMLNLLKIIQVNPQDNNTKQNIKDIVNVQMLPQSTEQQSYSTTLDLNEVFPLTKIGNFGRLLERKCRITQKGTMQFEGDKQPTLKQIKNFVSKIESFGQNQNDNKIGWIQNKKKYPFRLILIDKSNGHKAIYFTNPQKAEQIRLFLSQNYRYPGDFAKVSAALNRNFRNACLEAFKNKLISRNKLMNKSNRYSRNLVFGQKNNQDSQKNIDKNMANRQQQSNFSVFSKEPLGKSQRKISDTNAPPKQSNSMFKADSLLNTKPNPSMRVNLKDLQKAYMQNLFQKWLQKAKLNKQSSMNQIFLKKTDIDNFSPTRKINFLDNTSKRNESPQKSSRKQESVYIKQKESESVFRGGPGSAIRPKQNGLREQQSFIKQFHNQIHNQIDELSELVCFSIQFLTLNNLFFKPIVTIELIRNNKPEQTIIYNSLIKKKQPHLLYALTVSGDESLKLRANLNHYTIFVRVIDFLANEEVITDRIVMNTKKVMERTTIMADNKLIRLQLGVRQGKEDYLQSKPMAVNVVPVEFNIPPLPPTVKQKISSYWQKQSQSQGYYNQVGLSLYKILSQFDLVPLTWWKGIPQDDYEILQAVNAASKILGFKMIRSFTHIIKVFASLYPDLEEMIQRLLSFILTFLKPYYFAEELNRIQKFHRIIGLQQDCEFVSKVNVQILTISKLIEFQCPTLNQKLVRRNICFGYSMMQYIYQAFCRNFSPNCLVDLWNYILKELELIQLNMVAVAIVLIKYYEQDLMKCKRLNEFTRVLQGKAIVKTQYIIKQVIALKDKYFGQTKGFLDEIKNIFNSKPLQPILFEFYRRETAKIDKRKANRQLQKKSALRKVNKQINIQFPEYPSHKYCLHIYFIKLPQVGGSLSIRCNQINYECLNHENNRYFIISEVSGRVLLNFLDLKSNDYSCELVFNQGINQFTTYLNTNRNTNTYKVVYFAGLLTDTQIDIFKKGKKFNQFICPFVKETQFSDQMSRPISQTIFLRKYDNNSSKDDLIKKIKVLFCSGSKAFNQIQFYIEQIQTSELTIEQKIDWVQQLAQCFSRQFCLSSNKIFQRHFLSCFFEKTGFQINKQQFQCFYNDSLDYEFDAPKIIKCRFIPLDVSKQVKLQMEALNYLIDKSSKYLYADIIVDDFIQAVKPTISQQLGGMHEGELRLLYSSNGEVNLKAWQIKLLNKNRQVYYEEIKQDTADDIEQIQIGEPQILMTEVLPSFAKISTILDYVNSNRNVDLKAKYQDKDRKKIAQKINILKDCQSKFNKIISMRHNVYPKRLNFPFFNYYYELIYNFTTPPIKNLFLNNLKSDIRTICLLKGELKFGQNPKVQSYTYQNSIGLYGNFRKMTRDCKSWFFFSYGKDDNQLGKQEARIFVNYGYGVFRWQPCIVLGFVLRIKPKKSNKISKDTVPKKQFLILFKKQQRFVKQYELQLREGAQSRLKELNNNNLGLSRQIKFFDEDQDNSPKATALKYLTKFIK